MAITNRKTKAAGLAATLAAGVVTQGIGMPSAGADAWMSTNHPNSFTIEVRGTGTYISSSKVIINGNNTTPVCQVKVQVFGRKNGQHWESKVMNFDAYAGHNNGQCRYGHFSLGDWVAGKPKDQWGLDNGWFDKALFCAKVGWNGLNGPWDTRYPCVEIY